jgi:hypothetical protein
LEPPQSLYLLKYYLVARYKQLLVIRREEVRMKGRGQERRLEGVKTEREVGEEAEEK